MRRDPAQAATPVTSSQVRNAWVRACDSFYPQPQGEAEVQPDGVADDLGRKAVAGIQGTGDPSQQVDGAVPTTR